ncbi:transglutaminase-like domain-containing protein [Massilia sp. W12]|uniref:transglutaminase-like domain-containing protein n=1 Tax=Massilia sp. W12 TaxID=3126507 RepID=UPI0030CEF194
MRQLFTLVNPLPHPLQQQRLWLYVPAEWPGQAEMRWQASHPAHLARDAWGHRYLRFDFAMLKPMARQVLQLDFELTLDARIARLDDLSQPADWLQAEPFIESDHSELQARAATLRRSSVAETLQADFAWVAQHIQPGPYQARDLGALYALRHGQGDCTEYADLLVALARAQGIPARMVGGWVVRHDAVLQAVDYHNWAECWHAGRWQVLDAQRGILHADPLQYLAWRCQREANANPLGAAHRWRIEGQMQVEA